MSDIEDMKIHLAMIELKQKKLLEESKQLEKLKKMPFYKRIQQKGQETQLKRVDDVQRDSFFNLIKKRDELKHLKSEQDWLYNEYWEAFLAGKVLSINDFFYENRLAPVNKRVLKKQFIDR